MPGKILTPEVLEPGWKVALTPLPKAAIIAFPSVSETIIEVSVMFNGFPSSLNFHST